MTVVRTRVILAFVCAVLAISVTLGLVSALGETVWQDDGVGLCDETDDQTDPQIVSDGSGGAIVVWEDHRPGSPISDIYAQRVDGYGNPLWAMDGVSLSAAINKQERPQLISTGAAGAIVTWQDNRSASSGYDIYAQRVDHAGDALWTNDGVSLCAATNGQFDPQLVSDGAGGAIVSWSDQRSVTITDIYAQRVDASGNTLWYTDGVSLSVVTAIAKDYPQLVSDGSGGAIVTWQHGNDVYAQRVDGNGSTLWIADGVSLCVASDNQYVPQIISDGSGGAIVVWEDSRNKSISGYDVFAQRVDQNGNTLWLTDGLTVCARLGYQRFPQLVSDGVGGAIITWNDSSQDEGVYAQRLDANGNLLWATDGVSVCTYSGTWFQPQIASDGAGGAVIAWRDDREGDYNIYAQRLGADGNTLWYTDGVSVCTATEVQELPQLATDGYWGAIVTWQDDRLDLDLDIYAQRVTGAAAVNLPLLLRKYQ